MPNKTVYVSEDDLPLFERAQSLAGGNLSAAIASALMEYVSSEELRTQGYEAVSVRVGSGRAVHTKQFHGALQGEWRHPSADGRIEVFRVYRTPKNHWVLHWRRAPNWAAWSDPDSGFPGRGRWRGREGWPGRHPDPMGWWGPIESTLTVVGELAELKDKVPEEFMEMLKAAAEQPMVEVLDL